MMPFGRIGLGTVQFGASYGVSNQSGQPNEAEVAEILGTAAAAGIGYIDAAPAYGAAESLVGRHWPRKAPVAIVSKLAAIDANEIGPAHARYLLAEVERSLERLMCGQLHALLVHRIADLTKPGWEHLRDALLEAKQRGWTRRIGASIYDEGQLELVCRCLEPELIQLPLNALDRRMISSGVLKRLKASGIEVHARSVFLQGLLLMDPETLPPFFAPIRDVIAALHARWTAEEATPLAGCLACVLDQDGVDAVIVGVNRQAEFDEILSAVVRAAEIGSSCCPQTTPVPSMYLDPSRWPSVLQ